MRKIKQKVVKDKIPCVYLFIYKVFKDKADGKIYVNFNCIREIMRRRLHKIPRKLHYEILKEMEELKLIKRFGSKNGKNIKYELTGKGVEKKLNQLSFPI